MLCVGVVLIVLIFKSSDALATAYGIAVTGVMVISTLLVGVVAVHRWKWRPIAAWSLFGALGLIDVLFLASNSLKIAEGGWLPLAVAVLHLCGDGHLAAGPPRPSGQVAQPCPDAGAVSGPRRQDQPAHPGHGRSS